MNRLRNGGRGASNMRGVRVSGGGTDRDRKRAAINDKKRRHRGMAISIISEEGGIILMYSLYVMLWLVLFVSILLANTEHHRLRSLRGRGMNLWYRVMWWDLALLVPSSVVAYNPSLPSRCYAWVRGQLRYRREEQMARSGSLGRFV
mmetsp:Transcript_32713/g.63923  ORF Transcript_32713/g.63923 Transcript_32713/m.63923 type:complete len:147 (-) Transcript_32713:184-624(-)